MARNPLVVTLGPREVVEQVARAVAAVVPRATIAHVTSDGSGWREGVAATAAQQQSDTVIVVTSDDQEAASAQLATALLVNPVDHVVRCGGTLESSLALLLALLHSPADLARSLSSLLGPDSLEQHIDSFSSRRQAAQQVATAARQSGARSANVARVESLVDELLMNAANAGGAAYLQWATVSGGLWIAVRDPNGSLTRQSAIAALSRASSAGAEPLSSETSAGAGLGLFFAASNATALAFCVVRSTSTQVIAYFSFARASQLESLHFVELNTTDSARSADSSAQRRLNEEIRNQRH